MDRLVKNKFFIALSVFLLSISGTAYAETAALSEDASIVITSEDWTPVSATNASSQDAELMPTTEPLAEPSAVLSAVPSSDQFPAVSPDPASDDFVPEKAYLDADIITYNDSTSTATAEGNVVATHKTVKLYCPYAEYNSKTSVIDAYSDYRQDVVVTSGADTYTGKHLKYNTITGRGVMTEVNGQSGPMYMEGGTVRFMSIEDAEKQGILRKSSKRKKKDKNVAEWREVTSTTCDFTNPHYRLVSKKLFIYPGEKTIMRRPKFYIGKTLVMASPFDHIIGKKKQEGMVPIFRYNSNKGAGFGIKGPLDLGKFGDLKVAGLYWTKGMWEAGFNYKYHFNDHLYAYADVMRLYNKDSEEAKWRPKWGFAYQNNGWEASLSWVERELVSTEVRPDVTKEHDVWRKPEFYLGTPWYKGLGIGQFRAFGTWGKYGDITTNDGFVTRYAVGVQYSGASLGKLWIFRPNYGANWTYYTYPDHDNRYQQVTNAWAGLSYNFGEIGMSSSYVRCWRQGGSVMSWDWYSPSEVFVQTISLPLPFGASWEKWNLDITGRYDFDTEKISSVNYVLSYNKHCLTWRLWYRDNIADKETQIGLTFFVNAYPEYKIEFGTNPNETMKNDF